MGPELMMPHARAGHALRRRVSAPRRSPRVDFSQPAVRACGSATRTLPGRRRHRVHRRAVADARARGGAPPDRARPVDVRHLRRLLLPRPRHRRGRRGRLRRRGGHLPHQVRRPRSPSSTAATSCGPRRSCRTGPSPTPRSSSRWNSTVVDLLGDNRLEGAVVRDVGTGEEHELPVTGLFVAIGHRPNTDLFKGLLDMDDNGYLITRRRHHAPTSRACSPAATCRTTSTGRPSPPPARVHGRHRRRALAGAWHAHGRHCPASRNGRRTPVLFSRPGTTARCTIERIVQPWPSTSSA